MLNHINQIITNLQKCKTPEDKYTYLSNYLDNENDDLIEEITEQVMGKLGHHFCSQDSGDYSIELVSFVSDRVIKHLIQLSEK